MNIFIVPQLGYFFVSFIKPSNFSKYLQLLHTRERLSIFLRNRLRQYIIHFHCPDWNVITFKLALYNVLIN